MKIKYRLSAIEVTDAVVSRILIYCLNISKIEAIKLKKTP
jgi:hypothetical protein